jgi:hypothetical protein
MQEFIKNQKLANKQKPKSDKIFYFDVIELPPVSADKITLGKLPNGQTVYHCQVKLD